MPGIDPEVMTHKLNIYPDAKPIKQRKRMFRAKKREAIKSKVIKLIEARFPHRRHQLMFEMQKWI